MRLLRERGEDQLALGAVGSGSHRLRVDDLGVEVVLEDVQAILRSSHSPETPGPMISHRP